MENFIFDLQLLAEANTNVTTDAGLSAENRAFYDRALIEEAGLGDKRISATNIGFTLAPRLNASGRACITSPRPPVLLNGAASEAAIAIFIRLRPF